MRTDLTRVAPPSLYELEDSLAALLDTEALVTPEQEAEFRRDLAEQLQRTAEKRDRVGSFLKHLEAQQKFAGEEIKRLQERKRLFEGVEERLREYVLNVIEGLETDAKGKLRKLEGERFTLSARACPVSVEITDEAAVPLEYKTVTVTMSAKDWHEVEFYSSLTLAHPVPWTHSYSVNKAAVKAALTGPPEPCGRCNGIGMVDCDGAPVQCGACYGQCSLPPTVPGAELIVGKYSLQVK